MAETGDHVVLQTMKGSGLSMAFVYFIITIPLN